MAWSGISLIEGSGLESVVEAADSELELADSPRGRLGSNYARMCVSKSEGLFLASSE